MRSSKHNNAEFQTQSAIKTNKEKISYRSLWPLAHNREDNLGREIRRKTVKGLVTVLFSCALILPTIAVLSNIVETEIGRLVSDKETASAMPQFASTVKVGGVDVTVTAPIGAFPADATLSVKAVNVSEQYSVNKAVEKVRKGNVRVASLYTYDIKVLDKDGNEIQPADGKKVDVSFSAKEASYYSLTPTIYHVTGNNDELVAEALETSKSGSYVTAQSDGFSYYQLEFTYGDKTYTLGGDGSVALTELLSTLGIKKDEDIPYTDEEIVECTTPEGNYITASKEEEHWIINPAGDFSSSVEITVTIGEVDYAVGLTCTVTNPNEYTTNAVKASDWSYDGAEHSLFLTVPEAKYGDVEYSFKKDNGGYSVYSTTEPTVKDPGVYKVKYKVSRTTDHAAIAPSAELTVTVSKADLTITAANQTELTYGQSIGTGTGYYTVSGLVGSDVLTDITLTPSTNEVTDTGKITPGSAVIKNGETDVTGNYNIIPVEGNLKISPKTITIASGISASDKTYDANVTASFTYTNIDWDACGMVAGDNLSVEATGTFDDANVGENKAVTITSLTLKGTKATNYVLSGTGNQASSTADITARNLKITAGSNSKTYDGTPLIEHSISTEGLASGDTIFAITYTGDRTIVGVTENVPSAAVVKNETEEEVNDNYNITYVNGSLTITKKSLTITADSDSWTYDGTTHTKNSYSNTALADNDTITAVTVTGSRETVGSSDNLASAAVIKNADEEEVTSNYDITYVGGTLTVTKRNVTVTALNQTVLRKNNMDKSVEKAVLEGAVEDHELTAITLTAGNTETQPNKFTITPSNATIQYEGDDVTENYQISYDTGVLTVVSEAQKPTGNTNLEYTGKPQNLVTAPTEFLADYSVYYSMDGGQSYSSTIPQRTLAGEYLVKVAYLSDYNDDHFEGDDIMVEIGKKPVTITADSDSWTYDGIIHTKSTYSSTEIGFGDTITSVVITGSQKNAGSSKNVASDAVIKNEEETEVTANYDITYVNGSLEVTKRNVFVNALDQTVLINDSIDKSVEMAVLVGGADGDELKEITLTSTSTARPTDAGEITPSKAKIFDGEEDVSKCYDITYEKGVMTVVTTKGETNLDDSDGTQSGIEGVESTNIQDLADKEGEQGKSVKVELNVKPVSENKVSQTTLSQIKDKVDTMFAFVDKDGVTIEFFEVDLKKYVNKADAGTISDTGTPLEIILTIDPAKAQNPVIMRTHEGVTTVFTLLSARPTGNYQDGTYFMDGNKMYLYSQYFSDFSIAYSAEKTVNVTLDDRNGNVTRLLVGQESKFIPPTDITKSGHVLVGWYKDVEYNAKWDPDRDKVAEGMSLYAKWIEDEPVSIIATGDNAYLAIAFVMLFNSLAVLLYLIFRLRKNLLK